MSDENSNDTTNFLNSRAIYDDSASIYSLTWNKYAFGLSFPDSEFTTIKDLVTFLAGDEVDNEYGPPTQAMLNYREAVLDSIYGDVTEYADERNDYASGFLSDTSLGGNDCINCPWSYCRYDDIHHKIFNVNSDSSNAVGMGRVYADTQEATGQVLWVTFGNIVFKGWTFFFDAVDGDLSNLMNYGTTRLSLRSIISKGVGLAVSLPFLPLYWMGQFLNRINDTEITRYANFSSQMTLFYETLNAINAQILTNIGVIEVPFVSLKSGGLNENGKRALYVDNATEVATEAKVNSSDSDQDAANNSSEQIAKYLPEALQGNGIDVFSILDKRGSRLRGSTPRSTDELLQAYASYTTATSTDRVENESGHGKKTWSDPNDNQPIYMSSIQLVRKTETWVQDSQVAEASTTKKELPVLGVQFYDRFFNKQPDQIKEDTTTNYDKRQGGFFNAIRGSALGAGDFIGFRVERSINNSESISNTTGKMPIAESINQLAASRMQQRFGSGGSVLASAALELAQGNIKGMMMSLAGNALPAGISTTLTGNGYYDFPDIWMGSSFQKSYSFMMEFRSIYGDPVSWWQSTAFPFSVWLTAASPRGIGKHAYTSPYYVRAYCKGLFAVALGLVGSLGIERGDTDFGFTYENLPRVIRVNVSIIDLSPAFYLSIALRSNLGMFLDAFSHNDNMQEYICTLTGVGLAERYYQLPRIRRKWGAAMHVAKTQLFSKVYHGSNIGRSKWIRSAAALAPWDMVGNR